MKIDRRDFLKLSALSTAICLLNGVGCGSGNDLESETDGNSPSDTSPLPGSNPILSSSAILVVVDTLRADHVSAYGYQRRTTPFLDDFSKQAYIFENAISPSSWTLPAYVSIMAGVHAFHHNQHELGLPNLPQVDQKTLIEKLAERAYHTPLIYTNDIYDHLLYMFQETYGFVNPNDQNIADIHAVDRAIEWFKDESNLSQKFFMVLWLMSPHAPYQINTENGYLEEFLSDELFQTTPAVDAEIPCSDFSAIKSYYLSVEQLELAGPPEYNKECYSDSNVYAAAYDANIKFADEQVGRLFDFLREKGCYEDLTIIFTSDHGENMVDHDRFFNHGGSLYHSLIHVPLMIKFPGQQVSSKISTQVRTIDILPTFFDMEGLDCGDIDGKSLLPVLKNEADLSERPCISYNKFTRGNINEVAVVLRNYKLIKFTEKEDELYNLTFDTEEQHNIADENGETCNRLSLYLGDFFPLTDL